MYTSYGFYVQLYKFAHHCFLFEAYDGKSVLSQVSALAKIMEHGIVVDQFEEEKVA